MNETASPGPTATPPKQHPIDLDSSDDSPLDDLSSVPSDDEESLFGTPQLTAKPDTNGNSHNAENSLTGDKNHAANGEANGVANGGAKEPLSNGRTHAEDAGSPNGDERPAKRQRTRTSTPPPTSSPSRKPKLISPPWKRIGADGPTTFSEGGRRKSGRINTVPLELQSGDKRITRRAIQVNQSPPSAKQQQAAANGHATTSTPQTNTHSTSTSARRSTTARTSASSARSHAPPPPPPSRHQPPRRAEPKPSSSSPKRPAQAAASRSQPSRSSRNARPQREAAVAASRLEMPTRTTPRIRLRTRTLTIPIVHPDQIKLKPKLAPTLPEYFETAVDIPVEEGGLFAAEDDARMTDQMAASDAAIIARIERETDEGGILTAPRCGAFEPEAAEEPPRQWAHEDHMVKAMANFRRLMSIEQQRHRASAKRLAEACRDEWIRRQPKSADQLEAEARAMWIGRYRIVVRALFGTWENVKTEINRRRVREWEAEEQRRVKAALQEAVALSEQKLQARRTHQDSEAPSDEELDDVDDDLDGDEGLESLSDSGDADDSGSNGSGGSSNDESNMSSSEDEEGGEDVKEDAKSVASDEGLTQAQLQEKYANLPGLETLPDNAAAAKDRGDGNNDTSDESVDMDDDLGSTDMDSDDDDDDGDADGSDGVEGSDGDNETSDDDDEQAGGLLGMLFGKSELKKLKTEPGVVKEEDINETALPTTEPPADKMEDGNADTAYGGEVDTKATVSLPNGRSDVAMADVEAYGHLDEDFDDVVMVDMPPSDDDDDGDGGNNDAANSIPSVAVTAPTSTDEPKVVASPETDAVTTAVSPGRSQSPRTSDPKPSDIETMSVDNTDLLDAPKEISTIDMPLSDDDGDSRNNDAANSIPSVAVTAPMSTDEPKAVASPETDAVTTAVSPGRSQSPRTSDTKPSDIETMSVDNADLLDAPKDLSTSRSISPVPTTGAAPKTEIPSLLRGTLREYQHYGLDWLAGLYANRTNGILADEMGLGKTIQTIALLAHLACHHEVWGPHLVIVPTSVILNWEMEFKKWCPSFKILTYYGSQEERKRKRVGWTNDDIWNVCITSYQIVVQDQQVFKRRRWHYMILDEAHNIKNFKSQRWQSLLGFNTHARLLLTGTPLQNNLTELWSLLFFLMPPENGMGGFADLSEFHDWFHKPESQILESGREEMDEEARAIISKLHKVLRPYLLRRLKADVEKQMPAKYEHVELCRLSKRQRELYDGFLARSDTRATLSSGNYLSIINCLMQLRKVCNHPDLFVDRPIMTSFRMQRSVPAAYESSTDGLVRRRLLIGAGDSGCNNYERGRVSLQVLNLVPTLHETRLSASVAVRINQLAANRVLAELKEAQRARLPQASLELDASTVQSNLAYLENAGRWKRFEELQHCSYVNALRRQQRPIYGQGLLDMLTLGVEERPFKPRPKVPAKIMAWFENDSFLLHNLVQPLDRRSESFEMTITKFACVTPAVVTRDMNGVMLGQRGVEAFGECDLRLSAPTKRLPFMERLPPRDPWHEARMRLTIQFPDKRLLQYDCGKLQALDRLLRRLQAGGHRALIFTQMTKVLDILEQFLNIHGHKYLRLDGATKIEQRQILTDRFNHDNRILCFILSTRSGGLGINLTGADTVIFYDQDWNPAMDKQCQDRCHRIGQTRDVHIYRLVSEHTIEANILRKASQKQMLDDVVIQEGEFTTDYFNKMTVTDVLGADGSKVIGAGEDEDEVMNRFRESDAVANAAMDRVLGGVETAGDQRIAGRVLEQAEDTEDVAAARLAEKEILQDDADFSEKPSLAGAAGAAVGAAAGGLTATNTNTPPGTVSGMSSVRQGTPREDVAGSSGGQQAAGRSVLGLFAQSISATATATGTGTDADGGLAECNAWGGPVHTIDDYMLGWMTEQLKNAPLELPKDKKKSRRKKGKDTRKR